jgi:uncharacterized protein (TIGR03437 family)
MLLERILLFAILSPELLAAQAISFERVPIDHPLSHATMVGDFNGDGKPDLVSLQPGQVLTFLGKGDGTFQAAVATAIGLDASNALAADFDADGNLDLAVSHRHCCFARGGISILLGNGDGTFREMPEQIANASADWVTDVNGDGLPDLISGADLIFGPGAVLLNRGSGTFQRRNEPDIFNLWIGVVDVNGDGKPDIVHDDLGGGTIWVGLGNGDGTFRYSSTILPDDQEVAGLVFGDFDGDGKTDFILRRPGGQTSFHRGNGDGTFGVARPLPDSGASAQFDTLNAADLNGDGRLDLILNRRNPRAVAVILGNGDGTFQDPIEIPDPAAGLVTVADFNGDGRPDLLVETAAAGSFFVFLNSIPTQPSVISATGSASTGFAPGMLVTIRGAFLADAIRVAKPPLPNEMGGTTVRVNGVPAPLYYVSPSQINLQIPFDVPAGRGSLEVRRGSGLLFALNLDFLESLPAIFTANQTGTGTAVALHWDGTFVSEQSPAKVGETVSIICTGLGRVAPALPSGLAAPDPPPTTIESPQVRVGGVFADVRFSGLVPGYAGVYRVEIGIPDAAPKGIVPLLLSIRGTAANPVTLPVN